MTSINQQLRTSNHKVSVLHKCETIADDKSGKVGTLAVGKVFRFPNSGDRYQVQEDGSVRAGKNKLSKADRKAAKRARVEDRRQAAANLCDQEVIPARAAAAPVDTSALHASALAAMPEITGDELPRDIQVFPPGEVEFTLQDYPGESFRLKVTPEVAAKAQADLERFTAAEAGGRGSAPFADKNHEDAEATFHPVKFFWAGNDSKAGGVRVETNWTPFGAQLVRAKAFKYFSGNFLFSRTAKKFLGLINENIGGLVNRPGFASQQAFARADASPTTTKETMLTKEDVSTAVAEAIKPLATRIDTLEAKAKGATAATDAELDKHPSIVSLEARLKGLETQTTDTVKAAAKATVQTIGVKGGRIGAQDTATIAFWEESIAANAKAADALAKMPVNPAFLSVIQAQSRGDSSAAPGAELAKDKDTSDKIEAKARAHQAAGLPFDQAWAKATTEVMAGK